MAKREHLSILKQGVRTWNQWRKNNPEVIPDLSGANLGMLEFGGPYRTLRLHIARQVANLREANLRGALLTGANLEGVDFTRAKMEEVDLTGADLRFANLRGANLRGALMHYIVLLEMCIRDRSSIERTEPLIFARFLSAKNRKTSSQSSIRR